MKCDYYLLHIGNVSDRGERSIERELTTYMSFCSYVCVCVCVLHRVQLFMIPWTVTHQAPLAMGFSRQEY